MQLSLSKWAIGAGIYATNKRLFITAKDMDIAFNKIAGKNFVPAKLTSEQNQSIVKALSVEPNQISVRKEQISSLELKEPPGIFRTGHLNIVLTTGETTKLGIAKKKEYEYILQLANSFNPQAVRSA